MALSLDEIQSTTQDYWYKKAVDNYYTGNVLIYKLLQNAQRIDGGEKIRVPIWYGGPKGGAAGYNTTFDTNRYEDHNAARFDWAIYYEPVTYGMKDKIQNSGVAQEIDIVMSKLDMAQSAIKDTMADGIYGDGTAVADELPLTGLKAMLNSTTSTAYGNIAQDDLSQWAPGTVTTTTEAISLPVMRTLRRNCKVADSNDGIPSLYITTDTVKDSFTALLQPQQRFQSDNLASAGFPNVQFEGVPITADMKCPSGYMFALNEKYLDFRVHQDFDFLHTPWMRPTNEYKFTMQILWSGNLICTRRKAHGSHSNLS